MTPAQREALDRLGEDRIRHLLKQGMLVHHLMVPAYEWLDELAAQPKGLPDQSDGADKLPHREA